MLPDREGSLGEANTLAPGMFTSEMAAARPSLSAADLDRSIVAFTFSCDEKVLLSNGFIFTLVLFVRAGCGGTGTACAVGRKELELWMR